VEFISQDLGDYATASQARRDRGGVVRPRVGDHLARTDQPCPGGGMPLLRSVESLRITPGPAEVGGGNNNQRSRVVVGGERKANAALAFENKVTGYNFF